MIADLRRRQKICLKHASVNMAVQVVALLLQIQKPEEEMKMAKLRDTVIKELFYAYLQRDIEAIDLEAWKKHLATGKVVLDRLEEKTGDIYHEFEDELLSYIRNTELTAFTAGLNVGMTLVNS